MGKQTLFAAITAFILAWSSSAETVPSPVFEVPFEFENNRVRLTVQLGDNMLTMLLDSGASTSVLFDDKDGTTAALQVTDETTILFPALDEEIRGRRLSPTPLLLSGYPLELSKIVLLDDKTNLRERLLLRYDGIIGQELFRKFTVEVNPHKRVVRLFPAGTDLSESYRTVHKLYMQAGAPHIRFRSKMPWEQSPSMKEMMVDTGYPGAIVFWDSTHYRKAAKLTPEAHQTEAAIVGRANFRFGPLTFRHTPVYLGAYPPKQVGKRDGLIGASILSNFNYAIDISGGRMWMLAEAEDRNFNRFVDNDFYPPNSDEFVLSDFAASISTGPTTVVKQGN